MHGNGASGCSILLQCQRKENQVKVTLLLPYEHVTEKHRAKKHLHLAMNAERAGKDNDTQLAVATLLVLLH